MVFPWHRQGSRFGSQNLCKSQYVEPCRHNDTTPVTFLQHLPRNGSVCNVLQLFSLYYLRKIMSSNSGGKPVYFSAFYIFHIISACSINSPSAPNHRHNMWTLSCVNDLTFFPLHTIIKKNLYDTLVYLYEKRGGGVKYAVYTKQQPAARPESRGQPVVLAESKRKSPSRSTTTQVNSSSSSAKARAKRRFRSAKSQANSRSHSAKFQTENRTPAHWPNVQDPKSSHPLPGRARRIPPKSNCKRGPVCQAHPPSSAMSRHGSFNRLRGHFLLFILWGRQGSRRSLHRGRRNPKPGTFYTSTSANTGTCLRIPRRFERISGRLVFRPKHVKHT